MKKLILLLLICLPVLTFGQAVTTAIVQEAVIVNESGVGIGIDASTNALEFIDYAHHEIHSGSHYFYASHHEMAKNTVNEHLIITPNTTKWAHLLIGFNSHGGQVHIELSEVATYSDIGTLETARNRNRNFADASTTFVYEDPTITLQGTVIYSTIIGVDDKKVSIGGDVRGSNEIVLKQNCVYLFRITEQNTDATEVNIEFDWYEHTNKN